MTMGMIGTGQKRIADRLCLAAAPAFAVMTLVTVVFDTSAANTMCASMARSAPFTGMTGMYVLMSVFHLPPWLNLIARRQSRAHDYQPDHKESVT
jgi:hypothetical protein